MERGLLRATRTTIVCRVAQGVGLATRLWLSRHVRRLRSPVGPVVLRDRHERRLTEQTVRTAAHRQARSVVIDFPACLAIPVDAAIAEDASVTARPAVVREPDDRARDVVQLPRHLLGIESV